MCPLEGLCPFTHSPWNRHHCVPVWLCLCLHPPPKSPSICTPSQVVGAWPQLRSHAFSRTNDFYQNDNELMTHGSSRALERSQRTTGNRMEAGGTWGLKDPVSQKAHSSSVQISEGKWMDKGSPEDFRNTLSIFLAWPACISGSLQSLLCCLSCPPKVLTLTMVVSCEG